ncbi:MAG: ABC transporter permease [Actinomycetota bacterium]
MRAARYAAESARVARSQPVSSTVTMLVVGGVCAVILSTTGQTYLAERQVLARIDEAGTRSIVITDPQGGAGLASAAVGRVEQLWHVEWVIGLGTAFDVRPVGVQGGTPVAVRVFYGDVPPPVKMSAWDRVPGTVVLGPSAQAALGFRVPAGGVTTSNHDDLAVVGSFRAIPPLAFLERSGLAAPDSDDSASPVRAIYVSVERPEDVNPVARAIPMVLGTADPTQVSVETSGNLAAVRSAVEGELGLFGRNLVLMALGAGLVLVALIMYGAVTARRKDFGRRRALGAGRAAITALVTLQATVTGILGAALGTFIGGGIVWRLTGELPSREFALAVATLAVLTTIIAALPPAIVAAHRDPIRVLRVP